MSGTLYVLATPIGNLGDMTERGWETLRQVDFIAAEDTRVTMKLLAREGISKPLISYFEHNRREKGAYILSRLENGESCALVTDAGTPAISDPGEDLVALCARAGVPVTPVPGACAVIAALSASGMPSGRFTFEGFLSQNRRARADHLKSLRFEPRTMIFYEAPHKLRATLADLEETFGDRTICLARELTKLHEEFLRLPLSEARAHFEETPPRGEFVLIVPGFSGQPAKEAPEIDPMERMRSLMEEGLSRAEAARRAAKEAGLSKSELYRKSLETGGASED